MSQDEPQDDRPLVLVREPIAESGVALLREHFRVSEDRDSPLAEALKEADAVIVRSATKLSADVLEQAPKLKVVGRAGVGVDNVDLEAATRLGVVVCNTPDSTITSAAEHTLGLLLALARNIPQAHAALAAGRWERSKWEGVELSGKTLAVLGFGRIGQQVARKALALGMEVAAYDPFVGAERFRELGIERHETLESLLADADFVTLHSPLTDETRAMINQKTLALMKDGARLVNAARGALIDEDALEAALESGKLAGAALDVYSEEPYHGPLLGRPDVVSTPHLAASTDEAQDRAGQIIAEQVVAALNGEVVTNALNIPVVGQGDLEVLGPYVPLAQALGRLLAGVGAGLPKRLTVSSYGPLSAYDTRLLTVAALNGLFAGRAERVNYVNAPLLAQERGLEVREERSERSRDYTNTVELCADYGEELTFSGTTIGPEGRLFLSGAFGQSVDIELGEHMLFCSYGDQPGVVGRVGTLLGQSGVNIANMAVSRTHLGGRALMIVSVDSAVPDAALAELRAAGFDDVRVYGQPL